MSNKLIFMFLFLLISTEIYSQYFEPQSPLIFGDNDIQMLIMSQKIRTVRTIFAPNDINELKVQITKNNNDVENQIAIIKNKITNVFIDKQELLKLVDIKKMQEQITVKQQSRKQIEDQTQQDLANISYSGLYLVLLNAIDPWASKEKLSEQAEKLVTPTAIENLNGIFISSLTVVENNILFVDRIKAQISGEMTIEKQNISKIIDNRTRFLYLIKVNVGPLKKPKTAIRNYTEVASQNVVISLLQDDTYITKLQTARISAEEIKNIEFEVTSSKEVISGSNNTSSRRQQQIINNGNSNIANIDAEITQLKSNLANRSIFLKQTIEDKTGIIYDANNMETSINKALQYFDNQLSQLNDQLTSIKEKELIGKYNVNVTAEGKPEEDIAKTGFDIYSQIKQTHSKVEQFINETEVINNVMVSDKIRNDQNIYRNVEKIWLYPVAGDNDNFLLTVVAKFKISELTKSPVISNMTVNTVTDIDGNVYRTIKIGNQWWMAENLKVTHYQNGDAIPNVTDPIAWKNLTRGAYCNYDNDAVNVVTYGRLYNWFAVIDARHIAPIGWHVPTDEEWKKLEVHLGMSQEVIDVGANRGTDEGGKLKEKGTTHWQSPNNGATNESGFSALPGGAREGDDGHFFGIFGFAGFWSTSLNSETNYPWKRALSKYDSKIDHEYYYKTQGYSVRCVKD